MADGGFLDGIARQLSALPPGRRLLLGLTAMGSLGFFLWLTFGEGRGDQRLLYRGLAEDETARIVEALDVEKIPYTIDQGGTAIWVPGAQIPEARIRLASRGLPSGGGVGFEIFDKPAFGVTDFVHRINYHRAIQGELARSIAQLEPVERARVQIAAPERKGFLSEANHPASASVVLQLRGGHDLTPGQVRGIVHLVASSVEGLSADRITVVDNRGRLLSSMGEDEFGPGAAKGTYEYQRDVEKGLAERIESILERVVGVGGVVAHVNSELDFTQNETTEERFDPNSQVARSEQITKETSSEGGGGTGGVPGVTSNTPGEGGGGVLGTGGSSLSSERSTETINYEISKTVSRSVAPVGEIKRLHVSVLVDGQAQEDGTTVPWDAERLGEFEELTKNAIGFSTERGDQITVTSVPFRSIEIEEEEGGWFDPSIFSLLSAVAHAIAVILAVLLFGRFVVKPLAETLRAPRGYPVTAAEMEAQLQGGRSGAAGFLTPPPSQATLSEQVGHMAKARGDDSVRTLRSWLSQG